MPGSDFTLPGDDLLPVVIARAGLYELPSGPAEETRQRLAMLTALTEIRADVVRLEAAVIALLGSDGISPKRCRVCPRWFRADPAIGGRPRTYCSEACKAEARSAAARSSRTARAVPAT